MHDTDKKLRPRLHWILQNHKKSKHEIKIRLELTQIPCGVLLSPSKLAESMLDKKFLVP